MSNHLIHDLSAVQVALRVVFSFAITGIVAAGAFFTISRLSGLHP
jgi:hypothetical protein